MKIGIVADTHNNFPNFEKALKWLEKNGVKLVLHCGDISSQETIDQAEKIFGGNINYIKGNADFDLDLPDRMELDFNKKKILFTHFPDIAKKSAQSGIFDLVFYGHTHRPWDEKVACLPAGRGACHMINPGELAGQFYKPTFAVYDTATGKLELKILEKL